MSCLFEIGPVVLEKRMKNAKSLQSDGQTDDRLSEMFT